MPNYKVHDYIGSIVTKVSVVALFPALAATASLPEHFRLSYSAGVLILPVFIHLSTTYLSPDLDMNSKIYQRWGWMRWYWYPYRELVEHRSWISHSLFFAATFKLCYLAPLLSILCSILFFLLSLLLPAHTVLALLAGIVTSFYGSVLLADAVHILADIGFFRSKKASKYANKHANKHARKNKRGGR